jgi:putative two-component system response regulator
MDDGIGQRQRRITGDRPLRRLADIIRAAGDAIVGLDPEGRVETWNAAAEALFGLTAEQAVGRPFDLLGVLPVADLMPTSLEVRHRGSDLALTVSALVDEAGETTGSVVVARDVTDERRGSAELELAVADRTRRLQDAIEAREAAELETVERLSRAVEFRDEDTGRHVGRIGVLAEQLAVRAGMRPRRRHLLRTASVLHDVGKVAIPDAVLLKPGRLTAEERTVVETHAEIGHKLLRGSRSCLLQLGAEIALTHHERWDGTGYPRGLTAGEIPLEGRIVAIVDVYDALTRDRVYRKAFPEDEARAIMAEQRGAHFDPDLFDLFAQMPR